MRAFEEEVANGEKMEGKACGRDTILNIQVFESSADLLMVPLGDTQVILGTVWLKSLGPTLWDFNRKTLRFQKEGKAITLQGVTNKGVDLVGDKLFPKLLQTKGVAFVVQAMEGENEATA